MSNTPPAAHTTVLVIENDPLLMLSLVGFVEDAGCKALEAFSIDEALAILQTRTDIRTVVSDLDMKGSVSGLQFAAAIRDRWPPIEIVMTGSQAVVAREIPARGVFHGKPFDSRKIIAAIERFAA